MGRKNWRPKMNFLDGDWSLNLWSGSSGKKISKRRCRSFFAVVIGGGRRTSSTPCSDIGVVFDGFAATLVEFIAIFSTFFSIFSPPVFTCFTCIKPLCIQSKWEGDEFQGLREGFLDFFCSYEAVLRSQPLLFIVDFTCTLVFPHH